MKKILPICLLSLAALTVLLPLYMLLTGVFMDEREIAQTIGAAIGNEPGFARFVLLPRYPTLRPLAELLLDTPKFFAMFWNTCRLTIPSVLLQVLIAVPAAWGLSRYRFRGRKFLYTLYIVLMLMPFQVVMVPSYLVLSKFSMLDTRLAILLPAAFSAFPVFILYRFFSAIPESFAEAARLDGAGDFAVLWHIGVPLGMPGILSIVVLGFLESWSAIEQPLTFLRDPSLWPLSLFLPGIASDNAGAAFSASLITMLPAILIFLWGQPYLESGIRAAGLKE